MPQIEFELYIYFYDSNIKNTFLKNYVINYNYECHKI